MEVRFSYYQFALLLLAPLWICSSHAMEPFLDCPGNTGFNLFRRCCESPELPKGCECFDISWSSEFTNTMLRLPKCPASQEIQFLLYTRENNNIPFMIKSSGDSLANSPFNASLPTKFLLHGFIDEGPNTWSAPMRDTFLEYENMNIIIVNWAEGASCCLYTQAAANVRVVGAVMAELIRALKRQFSISLKSVHLIGHSLGAHACGMAGKEIWRLENEKIGRISGLDPAGPLFESASRYARLDREDASFVDVIHTDAETLIDSGYGIMASIGDVDFFPNGGKHQPVCPEELGPVGMFTWLNSDILNAEEFQGGACSHMVCLDYFINSIKTCTYPSVERGQHCIMGYHTNSSCRGDLYVLTSDTRPFC